MKSLSLQNISIGKQIIFLPLMALSGLFVIIMVQYASMITHSTVAEENTNQLVVARYIRKFQEQMTLLRLSEEEFLSTQLLDASREHQDVRRKILRTLEKIDSSKKSQGFDHALVGKWHTLLERHLRTYQNATAELEMIGFSEDIGLRGTMRNAIHIVERTIKNKDPSLMRDMLQIRRYEKDFIIRTEEKSYREWEKSVPIFLKNIEKSNLSQVDRIVIKLSVQLYVDSFRHLAKLTRDHFVDEITSDKTATEILQSITITSLTLSSLADISIQRSDSSQYNDFLHLTSLTLLVFASVASAGGIIAYHLQANLRLLASSMLKLAKGDINILIPGASFGNEIGQMANALRVFRDAEKTKAWAKVALRKSQKDTENIIESLNESLFELDSKGVIIRANRASEKLWGTKAEKLVGQKLIDIFVPKTGVSRKSAEKLAQLLYIQNKLEVMALTSPYQMAAFIDNSGVPMVVVGKSGTIVQTNAAIASVLGYEAAELSGQNIEILIPKKSRKGHHKHVADTFKLRAVRHLLDGNNLLARHKDGREITVSIGLVPFKIAGQTHMLCVCTPEDSLALGTRDDSAVGGLINGIGIEPSVALFAMANGRGVLREDEIITANGSVVPVAVSGALVENTMGTASGAIVTIHDITALKQKSQKILQFKRVLDESSDQVFMFWPDSYKLFYLNETACRLTGWDVEGCSNKTVMDFNPTFDPDEFSVKVQPLIMGETKQVIYERTEYRNDSPVEVSVEYVAANQDSKAYFVAIVRDITERKIAETAKSEFLSTVSHELRTPLTSIKGALGIINSGVVCDLNDKLKNLVSIALTNSDRLIRLINDILDIEKIASGKMDFALEQMDISELIHDAIRANEGYAKTYGVAFRIKGINQPTLVNGDGQRLMQVMSNLMSNAAKFSEKGQEIEISVKCKNNKARVQVKDYGSGIPKAAQATIFDRFTQADSSDQRQKGGTGLGLSIAKMIVEAHGGEISFNSVEGKGTTFYFDLDLIAGKSHGQFNSRSLGKSPHPANC